ncbi:LPS assembly protein LptD [Candidatus Williamhamiltonella defendens]|uniref:LPS-assembly protein LptD n=1 Tax=Candidatus Williamhamiltonella defendens TaxID=138072 RepID=A0A2D3T283_9ENTR|nr:LPS assembly protein LptD [Candidatus Hamiltonella defensa]ATW29929.1 LPS assembly protein LptD [Candidatus Hamiltonella defensa]ATW31901.1 LPS assembly protein LptD [Candidatus Hamiltonella defensa]
MNNRLLTFLITIILFLFYSEKAVSDITKQCSLSIPRYNQPLVANNHHDLPIYIQSNQTSADYPGTIIFSGNVTVKQGNSTLNANKMTLNKTQSPNSLHNPVRTTVATGDVQYFDPEIKLEGTQARSNIDTKDADIDEGNYQLVGRQGRGESDLIQIRDQNRYTILKNGTFTSCPLEDNSWNIIGSKIVFDRKKEVTKIWNARFKISKIPVFYAPYMQFYLGKERHSGFLVPTNEYSKKNNFEFTLPYYWNIAPNFDATITTKYLSKRGVQWQNEFRYLFPQGQGAMAFEWLPNDKLSKEKNKNSHRWLYYWNHSGVMDKVWRFGVNYTRISDHDYFSDLRSPYGFSTDGYAAQIFNVGYFQNHWNLMLSLKKFQVFNEGGNRNAYRAEPELEINYHKNDIGPFDMHIYGQAARFTSVSADNPKTQRFHVEPQLNLPLSNRWGNLNIETKLMATHYKQSIPKQFSDKNLQSSYNLENSVNRVIPQFTTDGTLVFDRSMEELAGFTQTLEPRVQYIYKPYKNQNNIYIYDSTLMQNDYQGLFRDRTYSGLDRIASANQVTTGLTSRIYDNAMLERFNVSIGQIYYFSPSRSGGNTQIDRSRIGSLVWAGDSFWRITDQTSLRGGMQYDTRLGSIVQSDAVMEYHHQDNNRIYQLNYRYASPEYIQASLPNVSRPNYQKGISQVGTTVSLPIKNRWFLVGAYYYDMKAHQPASELVSIQYTTCCWSVNLGYENSINGWNADNNGSQYENRFSINIQLRGLNKNDGFSTQEALQWGPLPYQKPF